MRYLFLITALTLSSYGVPTYSQVPETKEIKVGYDEPVPIDLGIDVTVETIGEQQRKSHSIDWILPERFKGKGLFLKENTCLIVASGSENNSYLIKAEVINWKAWEKSKYEFTLMVSEEDKGEEESDPKDCIDNRLEIFRLVAQAYSKIDDPDKQKWAKQISRALLVVNAAIEQNQYRDIEAMLNAVRAATRGELEGEEWESWPEETLDAWNIFREVVRQQLVKLDEAGTLKNMSDFIPVWKDTSDALMLVGGEEINNYSTNSEEEEE